jgi:hypothetical protein
MNKSDTAQEDQSGASRPLFLFSAVIYNNLQTVIPSDWRIQRKKEEAVCSDSS